MRKSLLFCFLSVFVLASLKLEAQPLPIERDPTQPAVFIETKKEVKKVHTYKLQSIIISSTRRLAFINGKFVRIGDFIDGAKVEAISKNTVILSVSGTKLTIFLLDRSSWKLN